MTRIVKEKIIIWTLPRPCSNGRPVCGGSTARSSCATTRSWPAATTARRAAAKTAAISATACASRCRSRAANGTSSAGRPCRGERDHLRLPQRVHRRRPVYLVGHDARTGEILQDATSCSMCRRMIINAGIRRVGRPEYARRIYGRARAELDRRGRYDLNCACTQTDMGGNSLVFMYV